MDMSIVGEERMFNDGGIFIKFKKIILLVLVSIVVLSGCQNDNDNNESASNQNVEHENAEAVNQSEENNANEVDGIIWGDEGGHGVVMSHGAVYDADSWEEQGEQLADEGMIVLSVEDTDTDQLIAAANELKEDHGVEEVSIIGASAGGGTAIDAVKSEEVDFNRVILLSPGGDATSIEDTSTLVIFSEEEGFEDLEKESKNDDSLKTISIPGSAHAQELFDDEETSDDVMSDIIDFLEEK